MLDLMKLWLEPGDNKMVYCERGTDLYMPPNTAVLIIESGQ